MQERSALNKPSREVTDAAQTETPSSDIGAIATFEMLTQQAPFPMLALDALGNILAANPVFVRDFGWSLSSLSTMKFFDCFPQASVSEAHVAFRIARQSGGFKGTLHPVRRFQPEPFPMEVTLYPIVGPDATYVVLWHDVAESRRIERELRQEHERFELALRGANDGLWDWNLETDNVYYSSRWKSMLGYGDDEIANVIGEWFDRIHPDDRERAVGRIISHLDGAEPSCEVEHRVRHKSGEYRWVLARGVSVPDARGNLYRMAGSFTDITDRKKVQGELLRHQAELAHVLRVSTMNEMASGIAHEINQPLSAIVNYACGTIRLIQSGKLTPEAMRDVMESISSNAQRAGEIIRRMRNFLRKDGPNRAAVDLNDLVREVHGFVRSEAQHDDIRVSLVLEPNLPTVQADRIQIEQVVLNLVRNGLEAIREKGGPQREVTIRTTLAADGRPEVRVTDTGPGMAPRVVDQLFDAFVTTKANGMGMGLSISRSIVESHEGRLWVATTGSMGTTICFTLPLGPTTNKWESDLRLTR